jgi:HD-GYP domain-containing protein (c-di-GMP phosphodiesterase class II)
MPVDHSLLASKTALDLSEVVLALSDSLDLVGIDDVGHGKRVAYMAVETARRLGLPQLDCDRLFFAAILHDCGISSSRAHRRLMGALEAGGEEEHCRIGHEMLLSFEPLADLAAIILHHHDSWRELVSGGSQTEVALLANAVHLADRADVLLKRALPRDVLMNREEVRAFVEKGSGERFAPELVRAFLEVSEAHGFWFALETRHLDRFVLDELRKQHRRPMAPGDLRRLAVLFARLVVSVADVFQALAQARPYREALAPQAILGVLETLAGKNLNECWEAATATA